MNRQAVRLRHDVRPGLAGRRFKGIVSRPVRGGRQIVEIGRDERQCGDLFVLQSHVFLPVPWSASHSRATRKNPTRAAVPISAALPRCSIANEIIISIWIGWLAPPMTRRK